MKSRRRDTNRRATLTSRGVWLIALALTMLSCLTDSAAAQVDPRGAMRTLTTAHLRVHVREGQEALGRRAAVIAEQAYSALAAELKPPAGPIDVLIADNVDYSNGYAQAFPTNRVVVYAVPPIASTELRFHDDWLQLVITHELAHIFHLDRAGGLWRAGRWIFGRNPVLFPNSLTPSWVKEGLAVHYESLLTGSGRLVSTESRTLLRTAARDAALPPISRWSLATSRFPRGQTAYGYGAQLMDRSAHVGGDSSMRRFVETTATFPIPFLLNRSSRVSFGVSFADQYHTMQDSLRALVAAMDTTGDAAWRRIDHAGWYAESPRWRNVDEVLWVASNGRDVPGLYRARVDRDARAEDAAPQRVARRNGLDVNAPLGADSTVFAQVDWRNPYELRSDLYVGVGDHEERLTSDARLVQPDVRRDGTIVAIQLDAASTRLVRVDMAGRVSVLRDGGTWADPRWSPDGTALAAIEMLATGESRVVVLDTTGVTRSIVSGGRAVFASPSFTPDGRRLVWSSDRSGRMQLETATVVAGVADTARWRTERDDVRMASQVSTGVYQPSVSPDGRRVAALVFGADGFFVSVAPLDTMGPVARNTWYPAVNAMNTASGAAAIGGGATASAADSIAATLPSSFSRYNPLRQLYPRYWLPQVGTGRLGSSTYGFSTSGVDILERHDWLVTALIEPERKEVDATAAYRYRGIGVPVLDASVSQDWDATFQVVDTAGTQLGLVARRRRFATLASTFAVPRIRTSVSGTVGAQYEWRDFTSTVDSLLGAPNSLLRKGTRYPLVFLNTSLSTARLGNRGISIEEGVSLTTSSSYRWRQDMPSLSAWRHSAQARGYLPLNLPGFARHVIMARVAGAYAGDNSPTELGVGGVSGLSTELLPGVVVGDPSRTFPVRGVAPGSQVGARALGGSVEYRAPLLWLRNAPAPFMLYLDRFSFTLFSDAARAWCPGALAARRNGLCEAPGVRDGWIASAGAELVVDLAVQYDTPYRLRIGAAAPYAAPVGISRSGAWYVTLGSYF